MKVFTHVKNQDGSLTSEGRYWRPVEPKLLQALVGEMLGDGHLAMLVRDPKAISVADLPLLDEYTKSVEFLKNMLNFGDLVEIPDLKKTVKDFNWAVGTVVDYPTSRITFDKSILEERYLVEIAKKLSVNYPVNVFERMIQDTDGKYRWMVELKTSSSVQLQDLFQNWYVDGEKRIPHDIKLTPDTLFHWFIGDGNYHNYQVTLCTDSFPKEDVEFLAQEMKKQLNIETHLNSTSNSVKAGHPQWRIIVSKQENIQRLFSELEKADAVMLSIAKRESPWKFDPLLTKRDVIGDRVAKGETLATLHELRTDEKLPSRTVMKTGEDSEFADL
jgi:hypothetical protein